MNSRGSKNCFRCSDKHNDMWHQMETVCRCQCTSVWKLACMRHINYWDTSFFEDISLPDLLSRKLVPDDVDVMGAHAQSLTSATILLLTFIFGIGVVVCERLFFSPRGFCFHYIIISLTRQITWSELHTLTFSRSLTRSLSSYISLLVYYIPITTCIIYLYCHLFAQSCYWYSFHFAFLE